MPNVVYYARAREREVNCVEGRVEFLFFIICAGIAWVDGNWIAGNLSVYVRESVVSVLLSRERESLAYVCFARTIARTPISGVNYLGKLYVCGCWSCDKTH